MVTDAPLLTPETCSQRQCNVARILACPERSRGALVRVGGSVGLLWRGRPRPRWRRPDAPHLRALSQMWVSVLRRWKRGPLGPRINSIYDLASAAVG